MRFKPHILAALAAVFISGTAIAQGLISSDRLIGRDSPDVGQIEQLTVGGGIEFTGSGGVTLNTDTIFNEDFGDFTCTFGVCVIDANSIALGTDTTGDYVSTATGTANEVEVSGGTGEGSTPTFGLPDTISVATAIELSHASENTLTASSGTLSIEGVALLNATTADALFLTPAEGDAAYQPLDSDLTSWAGVTRASGFDTFVATPSMANLGSLLTDDASGWVTFGTTPSSANLGSLLTDDAFLLSDADLAALASPGTLSAEGSPAGGDQIVAVVDGGYKTIDWDDLPGATGLPSDPGANSVLGWDDTANQAEWWNPGTGLTASTSTIDCDTASDSAVGCVELATTGETQARSSSSVVVTPAGLADFQRILLTSETALSGSGQTISGIPAGAKKITVMIENMSLSGNTDGVGLQIGDSGGLETSGYVGSTNNITGSSPTTHSTSFNVTAGTTDNTHWMNVVGTLTLKDASNNTWGWDGRLAFLPGGGVQNGVGFKSLSDVLDRVAIVRRGTTDTFDAGDFSLLVEF